MKKFLLFLRIFTIYCALFILTVSLIVIYGFINNSISIPMFVLFIFIIMCIIGALVFFNLFYFKFAHNIILQNDDIIFYFKNKHATFNRADCTKIWTNGYITKFVFKNITLWFFNKYFLPLVGEEKLVDIINDKYFKNAVIKKVWV